MRPPSFAPLLTLLMVLSLAPAASAQVPPTPGAAMSSSAPADISVSGSETPSPESADAPPTPARPDIIIVYIDDVPPIDGRFWAMGRTPNIRKYIIDNGLTFRNAVDEAPLCCPARANLLSGLHTRNNHVTINDASLFDPSETIATELQGVGYHTAWIGKYLNRYISIHGAAHATYDAGWDVFEPMSGGSYGYYYWHKGDRRYTRPTGHSMQLRAGPVGGDPARCPQGPTAVRCPLDVCRALPEHRPARQHRLGQVLRHPTLDVAALWRSGYLRQTGMASVAGQADRVAHAGEWLSAGQGVRGHAGGGPAGGQGGPGADAAGSSG